MTVRGLRVAAMLLLLATPFAASADPAGGTDLPPEEAGPSAPVAPAEPSEPVSDAEPWNGGPILGGTGEPGAADDGAGPTGGSLLPVGKVVRVAVALAVILVLIGIAYALVRRALPGRGAGPFTAGEHLGRIVLGPKHAVHLVRVAGRVLVVGVAADGMRLLTEIREVEEVERLAVRPGAASAPSGTFRGMLQGVRAAFGGSRDDGSLGDDGSAGEEDRVRRELEALQRRLDRWTDVSAARD